MKPPLDGPEHVQLQLGLYVLGALPMEERIAVEEHLASCADCRAERIELSEVATYLSLLTPDQVRSLACEFVHKPPEAD